MLAYRHGTGDAATIVRRFVLLLVGLGVGLCAYSVDAFLLAAPAINPIVLTATAVAFPGNPEMVVARGVAGLHPEDDWSLSILVEISLRICVWCRLIRVFLRLVIGEQVDLAPLRRS